MRNNGGMLQYKEKKENTDRREEETSAGKEERTLKMENRADVKIEAKGRELILP